MGRKYGSEYDAFLDAMCWEVAALRVETNMVDGVIVPASHYSGTSSTEMFLCVIDE